MPARAGGCAARCSRCRSARHSRRATTTRSSESSRSCSSRTKSCAVNDVTSAARSSGPGRVRLRQLRGHHGTMNRLPLVEPRTVPEAEHRRHRKVAGDQLAELVGIELVDVERVERLLTAADPRRERQPVGRRLRDPPPGLGHPGALGDEPWLLPDVLHDLQAHHGVERPVREGQRHKIAADRSDGWVRPPEVRERRQVIVQPDNLDGAGPREQSAAVPLATPGIEHAPRARRLDESAPRGGRQPRGVGTSSSRARFLAGSAHR